MRLRRAGCARMIDGLLNLEEERLSFLQSRVSALHLPPTFLFYHLTVTSRSVTIHTKNIIIPTLPLTHHVPSSCNPR